MTLPYLKGWGDTLAENGGQIGQNIAHIINPNIDFQNLFKAAIAKDPTILQQIANNPGLANSIQQMGIGKDIVGQTSGMQVDPTVAAQRDILGSKARVDKATEDSTISQAASAAQSAGANATVDTATVQPRIDIAKNTAAFDDIKYKDALTDFNKKQEALAKFPNVNVTKLAQAIVNGQQVDSQALSTLDPAGREALQLYVDSWNKAKERVKDMTVAQLVHHSGTQADRSQNVQLLRGLSVDLRGQLQQATNFIKTIKPDLLTKALAGKEPPKDSPQHQQWEEAKAQMDQYKEALSMVQPGSELKQQLSLVDAKFASLLGLEQAGHGNPDPVVEQLKKDVKNDPKGRQKLIQLKNAGKISDAQFQQVMSGK